MKKGQSSSPTANIILVILVLAILSVSTIYSINLLNARSRDAQRVSDLSNLKSALDHRYKFNKNYPAVDYDKLDLGIFYRHMPKDPLNSGDFKYVYISKDDRYVLLVKMEKPNYYAQTDGGHYNKKPLYYETGSGKNWKSLIPKNFK